MRGLVEFELQITMSNDSVEICPRHYFILSGNPTWDGARGSELDGDGLWRDDFSGSQLGLSFLVEKPSCSFLLGTSGLIHPWTRDSSSSTDRGRRAEALEQQG